VRPIRLLLAKDLRILRRSPALLVALVLYPLAIAALMGLVIRFSGDKPRVAFVDLDNLPAVLNVGGESFNVQNVLDQVASRVELIPMAEEEADRALASGQVLAKIVVPRGFAARLRGMVESPRLILRTIEGGLGGRIQREAEALVYNLNQLLQDAYIEANLDYVRLILEGGQGEFLGNEFDIIGLERAEVILQDLGRRTTDPRAAADLEDIEVFVREARLALGETGKALNATANPIVLDDAPEGGRTWLFSAQVQSLAIALTLAFLCVLLAAAAIASERDENVAGRLGRGLVRLGALVVEKALLAAVVAVAIGLALALVFGVAVEVGNVTGGEPWQRLPLLAVGLVLAGCAFGAFGVLLGVLAKEARAASLVAFLVVLPVVLIGLVDAAGRLAAGVSDVFPFVHAVRFFESALYDADPWATLARETAWLVGLAGVFAAGARAGVRRLLS
jgi:hypothetical protein